MYCKKIVSMIIDHIITGRSKVNTFVWPEFTIILLSKGYGFKACNVNTKLFTWRIGLSVRPSV